jgi:hypothetical protein
VLNQLPVVNVDTAVPTPVNVKFGALVIEPPVVPNVNVLVLVEGLVKPPVPEYVNPVTIAILNTVVAAVVHWRSILFVPKLIERVLVLLELNAPVVVDKLRLAVNVKAPDVRVILPVQVKSVPAIVVVPE